jgi:hypothetical protein
MTMIEAMINTDKVFQEIDNLPDNWIVLMETSAEKALEASLSMIKHLINEKDYFGIIVSASRPYKNYVNLYEYRGIDTDKILFIDCISKSHGAELEETGNVMYLEAPSDLTNISLAITESIEKINLKKFVFIDSVTTMLIYNTPKIFARFVHGILTKLRISGVSGLLVSLEKETDTEMQAQIVQLCDKIIKV